MRCLVTGAGGFIGGHLVESLLGDGHEVHALDYRRSEFLESLDGRLKVHVGDITERDCLASLLPQTRPDAIYHLAAQGFPQVSWEKPAYTFEVNVHGTVELLETMVREKLGARVVIACSSAEYAPSPDPISENGRLSPSSPYGVSKLAVDQMAELYAERYGLAVVRARPFFLVGPRKEGDVCSDFARKVVEVERGERKGLPVGNLDIVRDLLDIRDGIAALRTLAELGIGGEAYNICSGSGHALREVLGIYKSLARVDIKEDVDPALLRPIDEPVKVGDPARLKALGWAPQFKLLETLLSILQYWRTRPDVNHRWTQMNAD